MTTDKSNNLKEQKCPYCGKTLNVEEYKHAMEEFKARAAQEYNDEYEKQKKFYEEQIDKQKRILQEKI